ncbi:hypothetical protein B0I35DRAFT_17558 [Stachybotrys elegans]|uniref:Zn(2)-C6 fungal-type domain-containing protein n=1 Tax=Stachybotrys elegans TaxID=80388 RepID=A0A8K0T5F4_9HYPO|nr:hypothetical protein B0I35DRAFT_17558 [Stachybotrys elegans]
MNPDANPGELRRGPLQPPARSPASPASVSAPAPASASSPSAYAVHAQPLSLAPGSHPRGFPPPPLRSPFGSASASASSSPSITARAPSSASKPIRRRMRAIASCLECRRRKLKCDKGQPCTHCDKNSRACVYLGTRLDEASQLRLTQIKDKVGSLEHELIAGRSASSGSSIGPSLLPSSQENAWGHDATETGVDEGASDLGSLDMYYYGDDADERGLDDLIDLGVAIGKLRITDKIGGSSRPRLFEEIASGFRGTEPPPIPPVAFLKPSLEDNPDFIQPGPTFIPPSNGFPMGFHAAARPSLDKILPPRPAADRLLHQYLEAVHPVARCVHQDTFMLQYLDFWARIEQGEEPRPAQQALVFAVMFSAAVSMDEATASHEFGRSKKSLCEATQLAAEAALSKANFLRTTRFEVMQAFVVYLLPLCRDQISRAHTELVSAAIRMAECMGLHRDGETLGLKPVDVHVRRLVWHQLCLLDVHTCEAQGLRPIIRPGDYDTKLPANCDEDHAFTPVNRWTPMTLPLVRFEINEMQRIVWADRRKLEAGAMTLTASLVRTENFRRRMLEKYERYLDNSNPIQRYTRLVMNSILYRLMASILWPFYRNETRELPPRLNSVLVTSAIMTIELAKQLATIPLFYRWAWYAGAYQQFQLSLILVHEIYRGDPTPRADRVWPCLDYVFDKDGSLPSAEKRQEILRELSYKASVYQHIRRPRASPQAPPAASLKSRQPQPGSDMSSSFKARGLSISELTHPSSLSSLVNEPVNEGLGSPVRALSPQAQASSSTSGLSPGRPQVKVQLGIDWDTVNILFDRDPETDELIISGFNDASLVSR